jgi:RNA polymerase sigma-70 factor (ECF subfamily)
LQPTDLELLRLAGDGDGAAFHQLVDRHADGLFRSALSLTATRSDAEDLLQETLVGAFRGLRSFDGRAAVKTWLTSILLRQAAKGWRRWRRERQTLSLPAAEAAESPRGDPGLEVAGSTQAVEQRMDLMAMMKQLAPEHQEIIVLREIQGFSYDEISQMLKLPRGTVNSRLHRARLELRQRLSAYAV